MRFTRQYLENVQKLAVHLEQAKVKAKNLDSEAVYAVNLVQGKGFLRNISEWIRLLWFWLML
jgi:hypothetical protein